MKRKETETVLLESKLPAIKKYYPWIILAIILAFGFYLRAYHMNYPVIGYHNWKETKYLTDSRNFAEHGFFMDGLFIPRHEFISDINLIDKQGAHPENFPATPIIVALMFRIFGPELWVARLVNILMSLGTVFFMYLFVRELFDREDLALVSAFVTAINPMFVFFSHNTDIVNAAILFMVASGYFYVRWYRQRKDYALVLSVALLMLAFITKQPHLILGLPIALTFPYMDYFSNFRKNLRLTAACILTGGIIFSYIVYLGYVSITQFNLPPSGVGDQFVQLNTIFTPEFWSIMHSYVSDNFTMIGLLFSVIGLVLITLFLVSSFRSEYYHKKAKPLQKAANLLFGSNQKNIGYRFMFAYFIGFIVWFVVLSYKLSGHAYHQYPIAPLVIILISFFFVVVSASIAKIIGSMPRWIPQTAIIAVFLLVLYSPSIAARNRMFDTQFFGLDVAGDYIHANSLPNERVIHSSHQSYGVLWNADRVGYSMPANVDGLKKLEGLNATWVFIYQWAIPQVMQNPDLWNYMQQNYELKQFAFFTDGQQVQPVYFLLHKGGSFNITTISQVFAAKQIREKDYELTGNRIVKMNYINT